MGVSALLGALAAAPLPAQLMLGVAVGARYTSTMVHDSIVSPFDVRPAIAPAVALTVSEARGRAWRPGIALDFSSANLTRHDADGTTAGLERVTTVAFTVGVTHPLAAGFRVGLSGGGLKYFPSQDSGIFQSGTGSIAGLGALTVEHALPIGGERLTLAARYDIHAFTTPALTDEGFHGSWSVHRVALMVRSDWGGHTP